MLFRTQVEARRFGRRMYGLCNFSVYYHDYFGRWTLMIED